MLPKLNQPVYNIKIPNIESNNNFSVRPMLVSDEKILLTAAATKDSMQIKSAIQQVVRNCVLEKDLSLTSTPSFVFEYLYMKLWAISVNNKITVEINSEVVEVDISSPDLIVPEESKNRKITLDPNTSIILRYMTLEEKEILSNIKDDPYNAVMMMMKKSIEMILYKDAILTMEDYTDEEIEEFLNSFTAKAHDEMSIFFNNQPYVKLQIKDGIYVQTLEDFFQLLYLRRN
jgi:hypothetical protein